MATPANRFDRVDQPDPAAVTVALGGSDASPSGTVHGPHSEVGRSIALGEDGSLSAHQAVAVACHLANQLGRPVVVMDPLGRWDPAWGRLVAA